MIKSLARTWLICWIRFRLKLLIYFLVRRNRSRLVEGRTKYFCIGRNKTGTTSISKAFSDLGFTLGDQLIAEYLTDKDFFSGRFDRIIDYCETAEVFQDVPFSLFDTIKEVDRAFPGSKFILTVRDDSKQWYDSLVRFHSKLFGRDGRVPTCKDIKREKYKGTGLKRNVVRVHGTDYSDPYNENVMRSHYEKHYLDVVEYFKERPKDLLIINLSQKGEYQRFLDFIGMTSLCEDFPWENRT